MNESHSEGVRKTQIEEIRSILESVETTIQGEIDRTQQDWFSCFNSVAWKAIPTIINTAKLKGEIDPEKETVAQKYMNDLLNEIKLCAVEYHSAGTPHEVGLDLIPGVTKYTEGVPPNEKRAHFINKLKGVLEILES